MDINTQVGELQLSLGATPKQIRIDRQNSLVVTDSHARLTEACLRGNLYSGGMTTTSISNVTFTTGTVGATATPIIGVWNPPNSGYNLVIIQAKMQAIITAATATGGGAFVWCYSLNNSAITTGSVPVNRLTLQSNGSVAKFYAGTALTGLTTNLAVLEASALQGGTNGNYSMVGTAAGFAPSGGSATIENLDGSIVIPPGGVLGLFGTTTPVAISAASGLIWEEILI